MTKKLQSNIAILVATLIWGSTFVAQSIGMDHIGPFTFQAARCLLGSLALLPIIAVTDKFTYQNDGTLGEDKIFRADVAPLLKAYEKNVFSAWQYAFTEMMNNAIEHSLASKIEVTFETNALKTNILIYDNGIGIFKNILT